MTAIRNSTIKWSAVCLILLFTSAATNALAGDDELVLGKTEWKAERSRLIMKGEGKDGETVTVTNAGTGDVLGSRTVSDHKWRLVKRNPASIPCRVQAEQSDGQVAERDVDNAPADCVGGSTYPGGGITDHQNLTYNGSGTCLECHSNEAHDVFGSTHYQWKGQAPYMVNRSYLIQGKHAGAVNTYCGNITGNWTGCSACHVGLGDEPEAVASQAQLENIDCLVCHQVAYKRKKVNGVMVPDTDNMTISMDEAVRTVHKPNRTNCLTCHAKAGGGDALKRGDLALATGNTADYYYDVHMSTTGANLACQDCHKAEYHRFPGKGSDLRPTDLDKPVECATSGCHDASPHDDSKLNQHTARVACQACHIPVYAKDAKDSTADEATEINRSWQAGSHHTSPPLHPILTKANDLVPVYRHWDRYSDNYLLGDDIYPNPKTDTFQTSVPRGSVDDADSKLYPFKYKTSDYPLRTASNQLIALDTSIFFATADAAAAARSGLENMRMLGFSDFNQNDHITWVTTDTFQMLNHQVSPEGDALNCTACHMTTARMDLQRDLGYAPTDNDPQTCATGCHDEEKASEWSFGDFEEFRAHHKKHDEKGAACSECHSFNRN